MREQLDEVSKASKMELAIAYRSPNIELLVAVLIFTSGIGVLSVAVFGIGLNLGPVAGYNSTQTIESYTDFVSSVKTLAYVQGLAISTSALVLLIPLIIAFTFARSLEDGTMRAFLSYPADRSTLMSVKLLLLLILTSVPTIAAVTIWVEVVIPAGLDVGPVVLAVGSYIISILLVSSISLFAAVVSKRSSVTAAVGIAYWIALTYMTNYSATPVALNAIFSPVQFVFICLISSELDTLIFDLMSGLMCTLTISVVLFLGSLTLFSRMEV